MLKTASFLNEALLYVIRDIVPKQRIADRTSDWLGLLTDVSWFIGRSREHIECGVVVGRKLIGRSIEWLVFMLNWSRKTLNKPSWNRAIHSWQMHQIHGIGGL